MKVVYLNKPDKSDPENRLRVFGVVVGQWFFRLRWSWPEIATGLVKNA